MKDEPTTIKGKPVGRLPLGLKVVDGERVEDPDAMPLVREARRMRQEGHSVRTICRVMHSHGLRTRKGARLSPMDVWRLLRKTNA